MAQVAGLERDAAGLLVTDGAGAVTTVAGLPRTAAGALGIGAGPITGQVNGWPLNAAGRVVTVDVGAAVGAVMDRGLLRSSTGEIVTDAVGPFTQQSGFRRTSSGALGIS